MVFTSRSFVLRVSKSHNVSLARTEEIQKVQLLVFARLANSQEGEVFIDTFFRRCPGNYIPESRKRLDGVLGIVVVPGNSTVAEKREERIAIFLKPLLTLQRSFAPEI